MIATLRATVCGLFICLVLGLYGHAQKSKGGNPDPIDKTNLAFAKELLKYSEYQKALPYVDQLLDEQPESALYHFWMGKCLFFSYKKNMALAHFEKVSKLDPTVDLDFHYYYGLALHYNYDFLRAKEEYHLALASFREKDPGYGEIQGRIAQCDYAQQQMANRHEDWDGISIDNLGPTVNTKYAEHSPVVSANDSVLLYTALRPENLGALPSQQYYDEDLYISFKHGDIWSKGTNVGRPVNTQGHDATVSLTADGRTLYIYRHQKHGGLYRTDFDTVGQSWKSPSRVGEPLNAKYYEASLCVSADGTKLFFSSDRPGGLGGRDIYMVSRLPNGKWGEPANLGAPINSPWDDDAPYFHPDGKTLYYSSNGPKSIGGWDIFVTEYLPEEGKWLEPLNMGFPVNTPDDDLYFVISEDGLAGYYASGKEGGYGEKDIYSVRFPYFPYPQRNFGVQLAGIVTDEEEGDTVPSTVRLVDLQSKKIQVGVISRFHPQKFRFELEPEHRYEMEVVADGYPVERQTIVAPKLQDKDIRIDKSIAVQRRPDLVNASGDKAPEIMHIYYDFDEDALRKESLHELDAVVEMLAKNKDMRLEIHGHTDWYNDLAYNDALSLERCRTPQAYLVAQGIDPARIEMVHHSENKPLDTNENDTGRQFNRRAEFLFLRGDSIVYSSVRLRTGVNAVRVDHTTPKGAPGYDRPELVDMAATGSQPESAPEHIRQAEQLPPAIQNQRNFRIHLTIVDWQ